METRVVVCPHLPKWLFVKPRARLTNVRPRSKAQVLRIVQPPRFQHPNKISEDLTAESNVAVLYLLYPISVFPTRF